MIKFGYETKTELIGKRGSRRQKSLEEVVWTEVLGVGMGQEKAGVEVGLTVVVEGLWAARAVERLLPVPHLEGLPQDPIHSVWLSVPSL